MTLKKRWLIAIAGVLSVLLLQTGIGQALAYQTDIADPMLNNFTIALDSTSTVLEYYPENTPKSNGNTIIYTKTVQFGNTGYIDCYIRARMDFSDNDIENKSSMTANGSNWYAVADYADHLPDGWVYNSADGYYYYTKIVYAENWDTVKSKVDYDKGLGEYFYRNANILSEPCLTNPLVQSVKTVFDEPVDMRTYNLNVYSESVPYYFGNDYQTAWDNYLN